MQSNLRIEGDPTTWVLHENTDVNAVTQQLRQSSDPVAVQVVAPLSGRLLLNPGRAGSVAILAPPPNVGWIPGHIQLRTALLYVPSTTGPTPDSPGYALTPPADLATLGQDIMTAMRAGTVLTVAVSGGAGHGDVVISGAALPFAVLCEVG